MEQAGYSTAGTCAGNNAIMFRNSLIHSERYHREHGEGDREAVPPGLHGGGDQAGHLHQGDGDREQGGEGWQAADRDGEVQAGPGGAAGLHLQQADQHPGLQQVVCCVP